MEWGEHSHIVSRQNEKWLIGEVGSHESPEALNHRRGCVTVKVCWYPSARKRTCCKEPKEYVRFLLLYCEFIMVAFWINAYHIRYLDSSRLSAFLHHSKVNLRHFFSKWSEKPLITLWQKYSKIKSYLNVFRFFFLRTILFIKNRRFTICQSGTNYILKIGLNAG